MFVEVLSFQFAHPAQLVDVLGRGEGHSGLVFTSQMAVRAVAQCVSEGVCACVCQLSLTHADCHNWLYHI